MSSLLVVQQAMPSLIAFLTYSLIRREKRVRERERERERENINDLRRIYIPLTKKGIKCDPLTDL